MSGNVKIERGRLSQFRPATKNANKHTQRGLGMLSTAMGKSGYVAPMTAAADGEVIDGSARLEQAFEVFGDAAIIVHHDGKTPIVMVREDISDAQTPEARRIALEANRIAQVDLDFDPLVLAAEMEAGLDLDSLWDDTELAAILKAAGSALGSDDPNAGREQDIPEQWMILIECDNEHEQAQALERLTEQGYRCKALVS